MFEPRLFTSAEEIASIKSSLDSYAWYRASYENIKEKAELLLSKGFSVPKESGYVFYESCKSDNSPLLFDPYNPDDHICPVCLMNYQEKPFHRAWVTQYHAWLSQMSIHLSIVYQIEKDERYAMALRQMLLDYASNYAYYPNDDNELGPTRVFQSTYMESVWIMYLAGAYDMVRESPVFTMKDRSLIETDLFRASAAIICDYDEGRNNRQAFNNSGILAVGYLTGDEQLISYALHGRNGLFSHMNNSVFDDGFWYEGDNYHFATLPSIVNMAEMCRHNGLDLYHAEFNGHTIEMMYSAPLRSLQPDLSFPSRKDSVYASHIAQRWFSGLYELAYARYKSEEFSKILKTMYSLPSDSHSSTHNASGIMDVFKSSFASRDALDWRGFLNADPQLLKEEGLPYTRSINMSGTGLAVLRNNDSTYVSLDYGNYGGGHGHPDRLNLNCFIKGRRWFCDFGTGNYYFDHLRWYRSTIGHNTITVDGQNHLVKDGFLPIFCETDHFSVAKGSVEEIAPGVNMKRVVVLLEENIVIDLFSVFSSEKHLYHYALHSFGELSFENLSFMEASLSYNHYDFIRNLEKSQCDENITASFRDGNDRLDINTIGHLGTKVYKGSAYGPPNRIPSLFPVLIYERNENNTCFASMMNSSGLNVASFSNSGTDEYTVILDNGRKYVIKNAEDSLSIAVSDSSHNETYDFRDVAKIVSKPAFEVDESIPYNVKSAFIIRIKNNTGEIIKPFISLFDISETIGPFAVKEVVIPFSGLQDFINGEKLCIKYTVSYGQLTVERCYVRSYARAIAIPHEIPVDFNVLAANMTFKEESQTRRGEKHWNGPMQLSGEAVVCYTDTNLYLKIKVTDDIVLFDGGKFPYDNDSIQLYIDRRENKSEKIDRMDRGTYGLLVIPGVNDNSSSILSINNTLDSKEKIGVSAYQKPGGYEILLSIPFDCIGKKPSDDTLIGFDLIINDRDSGVRRDRQMIWSGCTEGERTYLKQETHSPLRFGLLHIKEV